MIVRNYSVRDADIPDHERIEEKMKSRQINKSGIIMRMLRRWEKEFDKRQTEE